MGDAIRSDWNVRKLESRIGEQLQDRSALPEAEPPKPAGLWPFGQES